MAIKKLQEVNRPFKVKPLLKGKGLWFVCELLYAEVDRHTSELHKNTKPVTFQTADGHIKQTGFFFKNRRQEHFYLRKLLQEGKYTLDFRQF